VVGSCYDGNACLQSIRDLAPSVALLDMGLPGQNGLEVLAAVRLDRLATRVVLLSDAYCEAQTTSAIARGAYGVICKKSTPDALLRALRQVASGSRLLPGLGLPSGQTGTVARAPDFSSVLTEREREVVSSVCAGLSNKAIGRQLKLTEGTIKVHLHHIYRKLAIQNRTALAALGHERPATLRTIGSLAMRQSSIVPDAGLDVMEDDRS
jgi:DNA-binding NarL/FixJ family response regulator